VGTKLEAVGETRELKVVSVLKVWFVWTEVRFSFELGLGCASNELGRSSSAMRRFLWTIFGPGSWPQ
jgi:hypothetical protein